MNRRGQRAFEARQQFFHTVDHVDDVRARLALNVDDHRRGGIHPGGLLHIFGIVGDGCDIRNSDRSVVPIRNHQREVLLAREKLVICADRVRLAGAIEVSLGLVHVGGGDRDAQVFERQVQ